MNLTFKTFRGAEIAEAFDQLAALRIAVFRDFPYLYEGTVEYEKEYLATYAQSDRAFLFCVFEQDRMVGATTCIPLLDETPEVQKPFVEAGYALDKVFYFGESILLPEYRGLGLGHRFFDEREAHARRFGSFDMTCFCAVDRGENHPAQPADYRPNDAFWLKRGYRRDESLKSMFEWLDIGEESSSSKPMIFWKKELHMKIRVASAQYPITQHDSFPAWREHLEHWVADAAEQGAELLLFPEYGSMELVSLLPEAVRADIRGQVRELEAFRESFCYCFIDLSAKYNMVMVAPSFPIAENGVMLNRAYVFSPKGLLGHQDKFFMTRFEDEEWGISSPIQKKLTVFECPWGSFGIQTCYDTEFGLGAQLLCGAGASVVLVPSCTETIRGATRVHVGARARALENQCYVVVSQTVGEAPWSPAVDLNYGYAAIYSSPDLNMPEEGVLSKMQAQTPGWLVQTLDLSLIEVLRKDGQVLNYRDQQRVLTGLRGETVEVASVAT